MDSALIAHITRLVLEKLEHHPGQSPSTASAGPTASSSDHKMVKIWDHLSDRPHIINGAERYEEGGSSGEVGSDNTGEPRVEDILPPLETKPGVDQPQHADALVALRASTPARIGVGRAGPRPKTETWLRFRLDHAAAVDAVYGEVLPELLEKHNLFTVKTMARSKDEYIRRPDLGRRLSEEAKRVLRERCLFQPQVQIIVSDGLSAEAVIKNFEDTYLSLVQSLQQLGLKQGTPFFIERGRVAVMDDVGEVLQPEVVVLLIGERPGLVSAESLSAYLCYKPRRGTVEADRMVVSNIHKGGIPPVEAGAYLGQVVQKILTYQASGVALVQKEH